VTKSIEKFTRKGVFGKAQKGGGILAKGII